MVGAAWIVMLRLLAVTLAPAASWMVTLPEAKVPVTVGVPVKLMVLPLTVAVKPVGKPLWLVMVNGLVPPLMAIVPVKPDRPFVHCVRNRFE